MPPGIAHGFVVLSENAIVNYEVNKSYDKMNECGLIWNDKTLNIKWPVEKPIISKRDSKYKNFEDLLKENKLKINFTLKNKNKYITIIGYSGYIGSALKERLKNNKMLKLIKSSYFYNNFVDLKRKHKSIIQKSKVIYYLTFNNDPKICSKKSKITL